MEIEGVRVEVGASVYHVSNRYFDSFVSEFGLKRKEPPNLGTTTTHTPVYVAWSDVCAAAKGLWGLWNGNEFVMQESEWLLLTLAKMLYRYGLSPFKVPTSASSFLQRGVS
jgi:hypothetical protein